MQRGSVLICQDQLLQNSHPSPPLVGAGGGKLCGVASFILELCLQERIWCFEPGYPVAEAGLELTSSCFNFPRAVFTRANTKAKRECGLGVLPEFTPASSRERSHGFQQCQRSKSRGQQAGTVASTVTLVQYWAMWLSSLYESKALDSVLTFPVFCSGEATPACTLSC